MSQDAGDEARERERDYQLARELSDLEIELKKGVLDARRSEREIDGIRARDDPSAHTSLAEDIVQRRRELLASLRGSPFDEETWIRRLESDRWQTELESFREHAESRARLRLIEGGEELYAVLARKAGALQSLLSYVDPE